MTGQPPSLNSMWVHPCVYTYKYTYTHIYIHIHIHNIDNKFNNLRRDILIKANKILNILFKIKFLGEPNWTKLVRFGFDSSFNS